MISVVIPLYNKAEFIARTIESVLTQTFQEFEIVIVNDGSTDGGVEIVEAITDSRIRIIHQDNAGVSAARNNGIEQAKYEWVALLDGDDIWKPNYLQTQWDLHMKYPECDVCACDYEFCDHTGKVTPSKINKLPFECEDGMLTNYFEVASCSNPPIWTSAVMAKRSAFLSVGGFPVGVKSGEDLLTWARLAVKYKIAYCRRVCAVFITNIIQQRTDKPTRAYDDIDYVGLEFKKILSDSESKKYLRRYIALWYKMKVSVNLTSGNVQAVWYNALLSLKYYPINAKVYAMMILSLLPIKLRIALVKSSLK